MVAVDIMEWVTDFTHQMDERAQERECFLQKYYHHLVRCIEPGLFYSWLRSKTVLSEDEQEDVETKYKIRSLRAGHLIDLMMRKGEAGYVAFLECLEYLYPDLYKELTGKEANPPPKDFHCHGRSIRRGTNRTTNSNTLCMMAGLLQNLTLDITKKNNELQELKSLLDGITEGCKYEEDEKFSLYTELELSREKNDELQSDNAELKNKLSAAIAERDSSKKQCQELIVMKESYFTQCNQLRQKLEKMDWKVGDLHAEVRREHSAPQGASEFEKLMKINQGRNKNEGLSVDNTTDSKSHAAELKKKVDYLTTENDVLLKEKTSLEERCKFLQENNDEMQNSIKHIISERDQYKKECEEMKGQLAESEKRKDELAAQCLIYHERICTMSQRMQYLDEEIESLSGAKSTTLRHLKPNGDKLCDKRKASYETFGKSDPLVIFAPKEIEPLLYKHLKKNFGICEFRTLETDLSQGEKVAESDDVICWKKSPTSYSFINKAWLQKDKNTIVVLSIPVHCVRMMKEKLEINPIVVIVKYKNGSIPEYTYEEEILNKPIAIKYSIVTVDGTYKTSFTDSDATSLVNELKKAVDMENKLRVGS